MLQRLGRVWFFMVLCALGINASQATESLEEVESDYQERKQVIHARLSEADKQKIKVMEELAEFYVNNSRDFAGTLQQAGTVARGLTLIKQKERQLQKPITLLKYNAALLKNKEGEALGETVLDLCYAPMVTLSNAYQVTLENPNLLPGLIKVLSINGCVSQRTTKIATWLSKNLQ